jgi:hypothetical protein
VTLAGSTLLLFTVRSLSSCSTAPSYPDHAGGNDDKGGKSDDFKFQWTNVSPDVTGTII